MRTLLFSTLILLSLTGIAGNPGAPCCENGTDPEQAQVIEQVMNTIGNEKVVDELGLTGEASVTFTIDQNETVHVEKVEANDFLTEFHIRQTLEGLKMEVSDSLAGKVFSTIVKFVQSK